MSYVLGFKDSSDDALSKTECYITNEDKKKEGARRAKKKKGAFLSHTLCLSLSRGVVF